MIPRLAAMLLMLTVTAGARAQPSAGFAPPPATPPPPPAAAPPAPPAPAAPPATAAGPEHPYYRGTAGPGSGPTWVEQPCRPAREAFQPYKRYPTCEDSPYDERVDDVRRAAVGGGGPRYHDGLYFRLAFGVGSANDTMTSGSVEFDQGGFAPATQIALGFTLVRGLVLGVGVETTTLVEATASNVTLDDLSPGASYTFKTAQLETFGPFVDWYFMPERGFHAQMNGGFAAYIAGQGDAVDAPRLRAHTATGWALGAGLGYDWFVADEWSLGLLARITYSDTAGPSPGGLDWEHAILAPAFLASATYH